jgi:magnesium-transporting ATPase (P-type)
MFSMALASLFLPFLPLLAPQILLNNFLSDIPAHGDRHRPRRSGHGCQKPRRWDTRFIRNYMVTFGLVSSVFDLLTFAVLLFVFQATGRVSDRLVRRVAADRTGDRPRGADAAAVLPQPPGHRFYAHAENAAA